MQQSSLVQIMTLIVFSLLPLSYVRSNTNVLYVFFVNIYIKSGGYQIKTPATVNEMEHSTHLAIFPIFLANSDSIGYILRFSPRFTTGFGLLFFLFYCS